jgi:phosphoglycolate phosphatase-like HAD superfamily hydrolase
MHQVELHHASLIAFDNDGTLYPAGEAVGRAVLEAHQQYVKRNNLRLPTPDISLVLKMMGTDTTEFYAAMMPGQPREVQRDFEQFCLGCEAKAVRRFPDLYPGAEEMLAALSAAGKRLVLISNGGPRYVGSVWEYAGYSRFFKAMYPFIEEQPETKGERLLRAIAEWQGPALMVGDRSSDFEAARYAGVPFIGCTYGYGRPDEVDGADAIAGDIAELRQLLLPSESEGSMSLMG